MTVNKDYDIIHRSNEHFLVNTENGDIFQINDVVISILEECLNYQTVSNLADHIFSLYKDDSDDFSKSDLIVFIDDLIEKEIISL